MSEKSLIREFYNGKSVFITGATGFVGKVLVEKLLRFCDGIDKIYILIRRKKGQSVDERWKKLIDSKLFTFAIDINKVGHKVIPIEGDLSLPGMGLKDSEYKILTDNISMIFHVAGDVKFNETMRDAVTHNLIGTKQILNLCKDIKKLEALVHVSTAYAFCQKKELVEKIYPMKTTPEEVIHAVETMDDIQLEKYTKPLLEGRPNNYTFAKALAEHVVLNQRGNIPTAIVRPSIVMSSYEEPIAGWIDNFNGPSGIALLGSLGIMRIADYERDKRISFIPVDMTSNALIVAGWYVATHNPKDILIYHLSSEPHNTPALGEVIEYFWNAQQDSPSMKLVRPLAGVPKTRPSKIRLWLTILISHFLFAYCADAIIWILGHKPILVSITRRMHSGFEMLSYFWMRQWKFHSDNTRTLIKLLQNQSPIDAQNLKFDVSSVDWKLMARTSWTGARRYLLKENDESIPLARKRRQKIFYGYRVFLSVWYSLLAYLFYWTFSKFISLIVH